MINLTKWKYSFINKYSHAIVFQWKWIRNHKLFYNLWSLLKWISNKFISKKLCFGSEKNLNDIYIYLSNHVLLLLFNGCRLKPYSHTEFRKARVLYLQWPGQSKRRTNALGSHFVFVPLGSAAPQSTRSGEN